jgi:hypothetical protein
MDEECLTYSDCDAGSKPPARWLNPKPLVVLGDGVLAQQYHALSFAQARVRRAAQLACAPDRCRVGQLTGVSGSADSDGEGADHILAGP